MAYKALNALNQKATDKGVEEVSGLSSCLSKDELEHIQKRVKKVILKQCVESKRQAGEIAMMRSPKTDEELKEKRRALDILNKTCRELRVMHLCAIREEEKQDFRNAKLMVKAALNQRKAQKDAEHKKQLEKEKGALDQRNQGLEEDNRALDEEADELYQENQDLRQKLEEKDDEIEELKRQLQQAERRRGRQSTKSVLVGPHSAFPLKYHQSFSEKAGE